MLKIEAEGWYTLEQLRVEGVDGEALTRACKADELRHRKVGRQIFVKGEWLLRWLEGEEVQP